jgi:putative ABC transport system permease protein
MRPFDYISASLRHHWRMHMAVAAAVAVATAVLTGALLMGESVRGSLRDLTLQRLGRIDQALVTQQFFRQELAEELAATPQFDEHFSSALPALLLRGSASVGQGDKTRRASELQLVGVPHSFWQLGGNDPRGEKAQEKGIWITRSVAAELDVAPGDELRVQLPLASAMPGDSPLGERTDVVTGRRFKVAGVLPDDSLARFDVRPSQQPPRTLFFPLDDLAKGIDESGKANVIVVAGDKVNRALPESASEWLAANFRPQLADYGLAIVRSDAKLPVGYAQISSSALVLSPEIVAAARKAFGADAVQPISTYLANSLRNGEARVPYSTVSGVDSRPDIGPLLDAEGSPVVIPEGAIALNRWAADNLGAKVGDKITLHYYEPESSHGELVEHDPPLELEVSHIIELKTADGGATAAADPRLTPQLEGVTDQESIADWDLPFELKEEVRDEDEDYWDEYSTTPKAFVAHSTATRAWPTRWGNESLLRIPLEESTDIDELARWLRDAIEPADLGFAFLPVKAQGLAAASGTTPFDGLFLGFSMFLMASAIMLIMLLFRLGMEQRSSELGLLAAVGFDRRRAARLLGIEGTLVAAAGALIGILLGIGYAWLLIKALTTLWVAAVASPFLTLKVGWFSLLLGFLLGWGIATLSIRRSLSKHLAESPQVLMKGGRSDDLVPLKPTKRRGWILRGRWSEIGLVVAVGLALYGMRLEGELQAGAFFGVGALALVALLGFLVRYLRHLGLDRRGTAAGRLPQLALANLSRQPGRSALTVGLVAAASFLLLAISSFRLEPTPRGTGQYHWVATSDQPLHFDLGSEQGRIELGLSSEAEELLAQCEVVSLRVQEGEDASCLNLYRAAQPRVLGVPQAETTLAEFGWTGSGSLPAAIAQWDRPLGNDKQGRPIFPVVIDYNTAVYALHLSGQPGATLTIRDEDDRSTTLEVVGLLKNSMLQGDLLVSEASFRAMFPSNSGRGLFLIRPRGKPDDRLPGLLESELADYGFDVTLSAERLERFLAVQNTYLYTFQSLGGLGLLLGTVGLAVVQLRSVLERRGELALLQAIGFSRRRVVAVVLLENLLLLALGLGVGGLAALLALLPQWGRDMTSIPWISLLSLGAVMVLMGAGACWLATRRTLRAPLVPALRGD